MPLFRKRPIEVEAHLFTGGAEAATPIVDWVLANGGTARWHDDPPTMHSTACQCDGRGIIPSRPGPYGRPISPNVTLCPATEPTGGGPDYITVNTLEGTMRAEIGDWIVRGAVGEFYPCKPDAFEASFETTPVCEATDLRDRIGGIDAFTVPSALVDSVAWFAHGVEEGWISEPHCGTHDGIMNVGDEAERWEDGEDPCQAITRILL